MNWDDFRFVLAVAKTGSLSKAAAVLEVDHTTVGRRIEAAETALALKLFTRTPAGYQPTAEAERLLTPLQAVEAAVHAVERGAEAHRDALDGLIRVTSPETFGINYLAPRLAVFGSAHPALTIELMPQGEVLDLGRREAEIAVRFFRSRQKDLVVRKVAEVEYGLYASSAYLARRPVKSASELSHHPFILSGTRGQAPEVAWVKRLNPAVRPTFVSTISLALAEAAKVSAGLTVLPRYLGDPEPTLVRIAMPEPPVEPVWLTVHRDLRNTPRIRVLLDFLARSLRDDVLLLRRK